METRLKNIQKALKEIGNTNTQEQSTDHQDLHLSEDKPINIADKIRAVQKVENTENIKNTNLISAEFNTDSLIEDSVSDKEFFETVSLNEKLEDIRNLDQFSSSFL